MYGFFCGENTALRTPPRFPPRFSPSPFGPPGARPNLHEYPWLIMVVSKAGWTATSPYARPPAPNSWLAAVGKRCFPRKLNVQYRKVVLVRLSLLHVKPIVQLLAPVVGHSRVFKNKKACPCHELPCARKLCTFGVYEHCPAKPQSIRHLWSDMRI